MKLIEVKQALTSVSMVNFRLPDGDYVPQHFHITEIGLINKHFIDCGGKERSETRVNFQLWQASDYDHRIAPQKFLTILDMSRRVIGAADELEIEVEYQQGTVGKFGLDFDGSDFILVNTQTDCRAKDSCQADSVTGSAGFPAGAEAKGEKVNRECC